MRLEFIQGTSDDFIDHFTGDRQSNLLGTYSRILVISDSSSNTLCSPESDNFWMGSSLLAPFVLHGQVGA